MLRFFWKKYNQLWGCTRKSQFSFLFDKYWRCRGYQKVETGKHKINSKGFKDLLGVSRAKWSNAVRICARVPCVKWLWLMGSKLSVLRHIWVGSPNLHRDYSLPQKDCEFIHVMLPSTMPGSKAPAQGHLLILNEHTVLFVFFFFFFFWCTVRAEHEIYAEGGAELMCQWLTKVIKGSHLRHRSILKASPNLADSITL